MENQTTEINQSENTVSETSSETAESTITPKKKSKKIPIILGSISLIVIALIMILILPNVIKYNSAINDMENGNYENAIAYFSDNIDYKDCADKIKDAYLGYGKQLLENGNYESAIEAFNNSATEEATDYISYTNGLIAINEENYNLATSFFESLDNFEKSSDYLNKCYFMIAENYYKSGELKKAQEKFAELDSAIENDGIKVSDRLATLEKYSNYVNLCGSWYGNDGALSVRSTHDSTGLWDQWDAEYSDYVDIKVIINDDGTFTFSGTARYCIYTNFSQLSKNLNTDEREVDFEYTGKSLPATLYKGDNITLTYSDSKIKLNYDYTNSNYSMNFTYRFKSSITYNIGK